jgi:hypothetical protein
MIESYLRLYISEKYLIQYKGLSVQLHMHKCGILDFSTIPG